jgi:hypothetical protein
MVRRIGLSKLWLQQRFVCLFDQEYKPSTSATPFNPCHLHSFPTKAFQIWLQTSDLEHIFIAGSFFHYSGMFESPSCKDISPNPGRSDPLYIVKAIKKA